MNATHEVVDVAIVGGGIAGLSAAYDLQARGPAGLVIGKILEVVVGAPLDFFLDVSG